MIVNVIYRSKKMGFVVGVLECERVLGRGGSMEKLVYGVCLLGIVVVKGIRLRDSFDMIRGDLFVFNGVFWREELRCFGKGLVNGFERICNFGRRIWGGRSVCCNKEKGIRGLGRVDWR